MQTSEPALRAVLFDAAGTLIRLREPLGATYARFFAAEGAVGLRAVDVRALATLALLPELLECKDGPA